MESIKAAVIMANGKADGKSEVSMRDSSLSRSPAEMPPSSLAMISFSLRSAPSVCWDAYGKGVDLDRSSEDVADAEVVMAAMSAILVCREV